MERDFLEWFRQTVTIEPYAGNNVYGEPQYGPPATYRAKLQRRNKMIRDTKGQEVVSTGQVYLDGATPVIVKDRLTLPDGSQPLIQSVAIEYDENGNAHHKVVYI